MSKHLHILIDLAKKRQRERCPSVPEFALTSPKYSDTTANGLTKCICDMINFSGGRADRISSSGRFIDLSEVVTDVLGHQKRIGTGKWIPGQTRKGYADINATIRGRSVMIEVKMKDKQSLEQIAFAKAEREAGGVYEIFRSFDEFYEWYIPFVANTYLK